MRKFLLIFIMIISVGLAACAAQALPEPATVEASTISEESDRVQRSAEKNFEIYQTQTKSEENTTEDRELERTYENFEIYATDKIASDGEEIVEYEIINPHTGKRLLRGPMMYHLPVWEDSITGSNDFWPYDSDTLLWVQNFGKQSNPSVCYLLDKDGGLTPVEMPFRIEGKAGSDQRYLIVRLGESLGTGHGGFERYETLYGILDHDLKTVLLPVEYSGPVTDAGNWYPFFSDGYMFAQRNGKFGVLDYNLNEKIPFTQSTLIYPEGAQICSCGFGGESRSILFLESGKLLKDMVYQKSGIHTVIAAKRLLSTHETTEYQLLDRDGNVLLTLPYREMDEFSYGENDRPRLNGELLDFPARTEKSSWAVPVIDAARTAGLIPAELDQLYKLNVTRRDFCMLAMRLVQTLRPELITDAGTGEVTETDTLFWDCPDDDSFTGVNEINGAAKLGIISGYENGSFEPFVPVTRQDAAMILANTAQLLGVEARGEASQFTDLANAKEYARSAIQTVSSLQTPRGDRLMGGDDEGRFLPQQPYTIEQAIATMYRLYVIVA